MAISNFKLPTGLDVSGSSTITGTLDINGALTASSGLSSSRGDYTSLFINNVAVAAGGVGAAEVSGAITASLTNIPTRSEVSGVLTASYAQLGVTNTFTADQAITGGLSMTGDLSARSASLAGDLTVTGDLTVNGALTYINTTNLVVADKKIVIATGSTSAQADLAGIYLASDTAEIAKIYYTHADTSWNTDKSLNVVGQLSASTKIVSSEVTGTTVTGSFAKFDDITGSYVSGINASFTTLSGNLSSSTIQVADITAKRFGSHPTNVIPVILTGNTGSLPTFSTASVGAAKYVLKARNIAGAVHTLEGLVTHDGTNAYFTSYASLYSVSPMISLTASCAAGTVSVGVENISAGTIAVGYLINYVY